MIGASLVAFHMSQQIPGGMTVVTWPRASCSLQKSVPLGSSCLVLSLSFNLPVSHRWMVVASLTGS